MPESDYFPPTPSASDSEQDKFKMTSTLNGSDPATSRTKGAPARVTLHLGHLPSKKDIKVPYLRSPSRVCIWPLFFEELLSHIVH